MEQLKFFEGSAQIVLLQRDSKWGYDILDYWLADDQARSPVDNDRGIEFATAESALIAARNHVRIAIAGELGPG